MRKKVLIIDNSFDLTGAFKCVLINALDLKNECDFHFLIPRSSHNKAHIEASGFECHQFEMIEISRRPRDLLLYLPILLNNSIKLNRIIKIEGIDIIHVNDLYNMVGLVTKCLSKVKVVTHIRRMPESFPIKLYMFWVRIHSKYSDVILAVSKANAIAFKNFADPIVLYDKIPTSEKHKPYRCQESNPVKILYLANYNRGKGQEYSIEIAKRLKNEGNSNFELNFYGGDFGLQKNVTFKEELMNSVKNSNLHEHVHFFDKTEAVEKIMKSHDIVLNLSDSESFSNVSLEALFYGVPLIATDVGGTSEMFINNKSGLLVPKGNIELMYKAVNYLVENYSLRQRFSVASKRFVIENFSDNNTSYKLLKVYNEI